MENSTRQFYFTKDNVRQKLHSHLDGIISGHCKSYIGVILTQIESLGLNEKQEKAVKDLAKVSFYNNLNNISDGLLDVYFDIIHLLETSKVLDPNQEESLALFGQRESLPNITDRK